MKKDTVNNILEVGTELILQNGYHNVGLNTILKEANIPKGSFYYYFKSKEDFGLQVIKFYSVKSLSVLRLYLEDESENHKRRIISFFEAMRDSYETKGYGEGCLLGNCSLELADFSESFSISIAKELNTWREHFEACVKAGQKAGSIKKKIAADTLSDLILTMWEGALLRMKAAKNDESIRNFVQFLEMNLL